MTPRCGRRFSSTISSHAASAAAASSAADAADHDRAGLRVLRLPAISSAITHAPSEVREHAAGTRARQVAAQHAQRRHAGERDQRRQREAEQQQDAGAERRERRASTPGAGRSADAIDRQQHDEQLLAAEREQRCRRRSRRAPSTRELQHEQRERAAPRRAEAAQHRRGVEMAAQIARRRERDRHRGQDHRDQRREAEELLGALERLAHLGPQVAHVLHPLSRLQLRWQPREVGVERVALREVGDEQPPRRAVAGLQQIGRRHVVEIDEQPRTDREQSARDLRLLLHDRADLERRLADGDRVAGLDAEARGEPRIGPRFAARRNAGRARRRRVVAASTSMIAPRSG